MDYSTSLDNQEKAKKKYFKSEKGKKALRKYQGSPKGKEAQRKYSQSELGMAARLKYYLSKKGTKTRESQSELQRLLRRCFNFLQENPGKTIEDFLDQLDREEIL